jgi:hypothetical protein
MLPTATLSIRLPHSRGGVARTFEVEECWGKLRGGDLCIVFSYLQQCRMWSRSWEARYIYFSKIGICRSRTRSEGGCLSLTVTAGRRARAPQSTLRGKGYSPSAKRLHDLIIHRILERLMGEIDQSSRPTLPKIGKILGADFEATDQVRALL